MLRNQYQSDTLKYHVLQGKILNPEIFGSVNFEQMKRLNLLTPGVH